MLLYSTLYSVIGNYYAWMSQIVIRPSSNVTIVCVYVANNHKTQWKYDYCMCMSQIVIGPSGNMIIVCVRPK